MPTLPKQLQEKLANIHSLAPAYMPYTFCLQMLHHYFAVQDLSQVTWPAFQGFAAEALALDWLFL